MPKWSLRFLFRWRLSAISETLGSVDLYVWSSLSPYDLIHLNLREYVCWTCILIMILGFVIELFYRPMLSIELSSIRLNALFILRNTHVFATYTIYLVIPLLLDYFIKPWIIWNQIWTVWFLYVSEEVSYRPTLPFQLSHVFNIYRISFPRESFCHFLHATPYLFDLKSLVMFL